MRRGQRVKPGTQDTRRALRWKAVVGRQWKRACEGWREKREALRQEHSAASLQPSRPAITPIVLPYGVQMRNRSGHQRGTWATYARTAREAALLSKAELARRLGVDRGTIHRWETGANRPEDPNVVQAFARVLGLDLDEVLAAAGLRPDVEPPAEPTREVDEEIELVRTDPRLSESMKRRIIELILERRKRAREASLEETRRLIDLFSNNS